MRVGVQADIEEALVRRKRTVASLPPRSTPNVPRAFRRLPSPASLLPSARCCTTLVTRFVRDSAQKTPPLEKRREGHAGRKAQERLFDSVTNKASRSQNSRFDRYTLSYD